jgi:hypothetical protein
MMKPILIMGTFIVNLALISYTLFIYFERKYRISNSKVLSFLTIGVILDISATICMIIGSSKGPFTLHGILGYSSLTGMLIDTYLIWLHKKKNGINPMISSAVHKYSLLAYIWWLIAYITGVLLVMFR